jgi:hypothetical protein
VGESVDTAVKERLRTILARQAVTEAELRSATEDGHACALILSGQVDRGEQRLSDLASNPSSSISEIAMTLRDLNELRPDLEELDELLRQLEERARLVRAAWLSRA